MCIARVVYLSWSPTSTTGTSSALGVQVATKEEPAVSIMGSGIGAFGIFHEDERDTSCPEHCYSSTNTISTKSKRATYLGEEDQEQDY